MPVSLLNADLKCIEPRFWRCRRGELTGRHVDHVRARASRKPSMLWQVFIQTHLRHITSQISFLALGPNGTWRPCWQCRLRQCKASTAAGPCFNRMRFSAKKKVVLQVESSDFAPLMWDKSRRWEEEEDKRNKDWWREMKGGGVLADKC